MDNINSKSSELCTGCGTCSVVCPKNCITMKRNIEGFYLPDIEESLCIECGLCKKVCYKFYDINQGNSIEDSSGYLSFSNDEEIRYNASSGGIGKELTLYGIENGYEVCGAEYNYSNEKVEHVIINNISELDRIVGSKYIPSNTSRGFSKLDKNKKYIIIGTPCQIYGLSQIKSLNKLNCDTILVDFFCHGTPSLNLWDKYLEMIKDRLGIRKIESINFRDKKIGWHNFSMFIEGEGKVFREEMGKDLFLQFFLENVDLNTPCYNCKLRFNKLFSDIRLGDFWGSKCKNDKKGTSLVLVNTQLGKNIINSMDNIYKEKVTFLEIKESQYCKKINTPKEKERISLALKSEEKLINIYENHLLAIRKRKKYKSILNFPIRKFNGFIRKIRRIYS